MNTAREKKDGTKVENSAERKLLWDEENRLEAIDENGFVSNYWYDAAGERTVKTSGESEQMFVNALFSGGSTSTANFTAYVNPYIVVSKGGHYTKHIYIGSQRIVSKLGDLDSYGADPRRIEYAGANMDGALVDYQSKYEASQQTIKDRYAIFDVPYLGKDNEDYVNGQGFCCDDTPQGAATRGNDNPELFQYYYHSDHLGSTSLITNLDGEIVQHVKYVPFGEVFIEERNNTWNTPYLFNAKELDEETGLYYYGARYYEPRTSVWLSADPMQEKYPNISTYVYTAQNPVKYIDPDGRVIKVPNQKLFTIIKLAQIAASNEGMNVVNSLIQSDYTYTTNKVFWTHNSQYNPATRTVSHVKGTSYLLLEGGSVSDRLILGHELFHAQQHEKGKVNFRSDGSVVNKKDMEWGAVRFQNYLASVYDYSFMREGYGKDKFFAGLTEFSFNPDKEKITDFFMIDANMERDSYGFSFNKSMGEGQSQAFYMVAGTDSDGKFHFQTFDNKDDYEGKWKEWNQ